MDRDLSTIDQMVALCKKVYCIYRSFRHPTYMIPTPDTKIKQWERLAQALQARSIDPHHYFEFCFSEYGPSFYVENVCSLKAVVNFEKQRTVYENRHERDTESHLARLNGRLKFGHDIRDILEDDRESFNVAFKLIVAEYYGLRDIVEKYEDKARALFLLAPNYRRSLEKWVKESQEKT